MAPRMILRRNGAGQERYEEGTMGTNEVRKERWEWMISGRNVGKEWCEEGSLGPPSRWRGKNDGGERTMEKMEERTGRSKNVTMKARTMELENERKGSTWGDRKDRTKA